MTSSGSTAIDALSTRVNGNWAAIAKSIQNSKKKKQDLLDLFSRGNKPDSEDRSVIAFGSIGRDEWTSGSDLDWTLLIDGQADSAHLEIAQEIEAKLLHANFKPPGQTGVFGNMAFSHEIIHRIGGENDTNRNMTQRVLLILESTVIGERVEARDRVIRGVFNRYLEEETGLPDSTGTHFNVPRFLLNDIVRFWRTMAVDFASKQRERGGRGWGLRNAKLRMSRKLIFVSGLLMCFSCSFQSPGHAGTQSSGGGVNPLLRHLLSLVVKTPLEKLAEAIALYGESDQTARQIFDAYDKFLALLDDDSSRNELEKLTADDATRNATFDAVRRISHEFQTGLDQLFFKNNQLAPLTMKYGVF